MPIEIDELREAAEASLPLIIQQRRRLEQSLIGKSVAERAPIQAEIDEMLVREFLVRRIQRDIAASENPMGVLDTVLQRRLDELAGRLEAAIVTNARIGATLTSALALALDASQRTVQRAVAELEAAGQVRALGQARARRWVAAPLVDFTTILLLPASLPGA